MMKDIENQIKELELETARLELDDELCHLKHNQKNDPIEDHPAVDYLVQYLGKTDTFIQEAEHELRIPICQDCIDVLSDPNWFLMYCVTCTSSQWIYRPLHYLPLPNTNIQWLDECPYCKGM